ncbi:MAG: hypothetical protein N2749_00745 [Clostridia bacterium]|nr:hypothetical protein [Clostridia bacterium]
MNISSKTQNDLIETTLDYCQRIINKMKEISVFIESEDRKNNAGLYVNMIKVNKMREEIRILRKKIHENIATINFMYNNISLDDKDYDEYLNKINRNATFVQSDLFDMINKNIVFTKNSKIANIVFKFRNNGFEEWDDNIVLKIIIYNKNTGVRTEQYAYLKQQHVNTGDVGEFVINELVMPPLKNIYNVTLELVNQSDNYIYCSEKISDLNVSD